MIKKQNIQNKRLKRIVNDYNEIQKWLVKHRKVLEILKKDHELLSSKPPYKINFAVDFHEIYQIVFPLIRKKEKKKIKDSEKNDWIRHKAVSQSGRICLFYGIEILPVPILLPPYRDELEDFLFWLKAEYKKAAQQYHLLSELKNSIQTALHEEGIDFIGDGKHFKISDKQYSKIIRFIEKYFLQLSILLGGYTEALSILKSLFTDNKIEMVSDRWIEYSELINKEIKKVPDAWYGFIREYRKENQQNSQQRERDIKRANERDIIALHLIKALNIKFKVENKLEIVILVSDAEIFKYLLSPTLHDNIKQKRIGGYVKTATGEKIEILRTTDVFHTYLLIKKEREELKSLYRQKSSANPISQINKIKLTNIRNDLHKIKLIERFVKEINQIIEFCNKNGWDCQNLGSCQYEAICTTSEKVIKDFQEDRKSLESLALAEGFDIFAKIYRHYQRIFDFDEGVKQILSLLQNDEKIGNIINKKLEEIREHISKGFEELSLDATYKIESVPNVIKIPKENSFRIKTYEEEIDEIIRNIQKSIRQNNQENFLCHFSALKDKRKQIDQSKSLEYLLSSLISAAYDKYDLSLYFLERGLIFTGEKTILYREHKYLEAIIYCNNKQYEKALILCKKLLESHQNDARFLYFCGYIILTGRDDNQLEEYSNEEAVKYCKEALFIFDETKDDDSDLNLFILNNLIYALAKIGTLEAMKDAEQYLIELQRCSDPENDWGFHIWHTIGYVSLRKAELLKEKNVDYKEIIYKAIENFKIADKKVYGENPIIKRDLNKAKEMLNAVYPANVQSG
jgi:hypothetical protein